MIQSCKEQLKTEWRVQLVNFNKDEKFENIIRPSLKNTYLCISNTLIKASELKPEKIFQITGIKEWRDLTYCKESFRCSEENSDIKKISILTSIHPLYFPKLLIKNNELIQFKNSKTFLGVYLYEDVEPFTTLGIYGGELIKESSFAIENGMEAMFTMSAERAYVLEDRDAKEIGNAISRVNFGFPNFILRSAFDTGFKEYYAISGQKILKNEELLMNYGLDVPALTWNSPLVLLGTERMELFYENGLDEVKNKIEETCIHAIKKMNKKKFLFLVYILEQIKYCLAVPGAQLHLHYKGLVKIQEWTADCDKECFYSKEIKHYYSNSIYRSMQDKFVKFVSDFDNHSTSLNLAKEWIMNSIGKYSIFQILKGMEQLLEYKPCEKKEFDKAIVRIEKFLVGYNPFKDDKWIFKDIN